MCGILGLFHSGPNEQPSEGLFCHALNMMHHRGPDFQKHTQHGKIMLGHTRLAIIDLDQKSNQPMYDQSKRYCLVFNGEIFNYKELKKELEQTGHKFKTNSDTEVLLELLKEKGVEAAKKLNGFFAFAFVDLLTNEIIIARDQYGIKPLFYFEDRQNFYFSSELRSLIKLKKNVQIAQESLYYFLTLSYIPQPFSIIEGVKKLPPGYLAHWCNSKLMLKKYYELAVVKPSNDTYEEAQKKIVNLVEKSIELRLNSDVPIGVFLSGGIDSSIVTAVASGLQPNLKTFSIGLDHNKYDDESSYAEMVAKKFQTEHHTFRVSKNDIINSIYHVIDSIDEPFSDTSTILTNIICKQAGEKIKVALSGDGADEIFSGYNKHQAEFLITNCPVQKKLFQTVGSMTSFLPQSREGIIGDTIRKLTKFNRISKLSPLNRYHQLCRFTGNEQARLLIKAKLNENDLLENLQNELGLKELDQNNFNDFLYNDAKMVLPADMLAKVDMMSMANSIEVRPVFLDPNLVNYLFSLPANYKIDSKNRKKILKDSFKDVLPPKILSRPKKGFSVSLIKLFQNELKPFIEDTLKQANFIENSLFQTKAIEQLKKQLFSSAPGDIQQTVWSLVIFEHWKKKNL